MRLAIELVAADRLRCLPLLVITAENFATISTFVPRHILDIPKRERSNPSMPGFFIAEAGKGDTFPPFETHSSPPFPRTPSPKTQRFTDWLRSHCCGNPLLKISRSG